VTEEKEQYKATLEAIQVLPEAPASATVRCIVEGFDWMITIREFDQPNPGRQLLSKLKAINTELKTMGAEPMVNNYRSSPPPKPKPKAEEKAEEEHPKQKDCPLHPGMFLKLHTKGSQHWYSHKLDDGTWCKGE